MIRSMKLAAPGFALLCLVAAPSTLSAAEKAVLRDRVAAGQTVSFDVFLPIEHRAQLESELQALHDPSSPKYQKWMTPAQFNARFGPSEAARSAIEADLAGRGLETSLVSPRHLKVTGPAAAVERTFNTTLKHGAYKSGKSVIAAATPIAQLDSIAGAGAAVVGLSGFVTMRPHAHKAALPDNRYSTAGPYWFTDLKQAYKFPSAQVYAGQGVTIGILMTGAFNPPDMPLYFNHERLATPNFSTVTVDGGAAFDPNGGSFETHLDLQQSGGMAPAARIVLYNIPDLSDDHILDGLDQILTDNITDVVSMSFGGPELGYAPSFNGGVDYTDILRLEDDFFAQGNAQGISFVASSGDAGALSIPPVHCFDSPAPPNCGNFLVSAEFPASSPHVTGVGGTNLATTYTSGSKDSIYVSEEAYGDPLASDIFYGTSATGGYWGSGGGTSIVFKRPYFQSLTNTGSKKFRTVPDVSGHMGGCPYGVLGTCNVADSADLEVIAGSLTGVIGTSASAPDFAGLTALTLQRYGTRLGNMNYYIYSLALAQSLGVVSNIFNTGIPGYNGAYSTSTSGYDRVLGNGTVNGVNFLLAPATPTAGTPQTITNP